MVGEFLPEHEKPDEKDKENPAQKWLSQEFQNSMKDFSEISNERRKLVSDAEGRFAVRMGRGMSEQQGDVVEALAPLAMLAFPAAPVTKLFAADVVVGGSPYDKDNKNKPAEEASPDTKARQREKDKWQKAA